MAVLVLALKSGDDDDMARVEVLVDFLGRDIENFRLGMDAVGDDAGLRPGQRDGGNAEAMKGEGEKSDGLLLAGGEEDVDFARGGVGG